MPPAHLRSEVWHDLLSSQHFLHARQDLTSIVLHRYRVLFNTLLKGADDLEEGLIQDEKPFAGTRRFGMCWVSKSFCYVKVVLQLQGHCQIHQRLLAWPRAPTRAKLRRLAQRSGSRITTAWMMAAWP